MSTPTFDANAPWGATPGDLFWFRPEVAPRVAALRQALQRWGTWTPVEDVPAARAAVEHCGEQLEALFRAQGRATGSGSFLDVAASNEAPRWSFLNAPMGGLRSGMDQGVVATDKAGGHWQHPLMTAVRYSALPAIEHLVDRGRLRPTAPRATLVDEDGALVKDYLEDDGVDSRYGVVGTAEVAVVLARRGLAGGLAVLQRYEIDPGALKQQAMFWVDGAIDGRHAEVIEEAAPWFDPSVRATPPFESPMDQLLVYDSDEMRNRATLTQELQGIDTPDLLRTHLDALLRLAPWESWLHQDDHDHLGVQSRTEWLETVVSLGADWAFDHLFPDVCPDPATFDRWCANWDRIEPGMDPEPVEVARNAMRQRLARHLLDAAPLPDLPPVDPTSRRRL